MIWLNFIYRYLHVTSCSTTTILYNSFWETNSKKLGPWYAADFECLSFRNGDFRSYFSLHFFANSAYFVSYYPRAILLEEIRAIHQFCVNVHRPRNQSMVPLTRLPRSHVPSTDPPPPWSSSTVTNYSIRVATSSEVSRQLKIDRRGCPVPTQNVSIIPRRRCPFRRPRRGNPPRDGGYTPGVRGNKKWWSPPRALICNVRGGWNGGGISKPGHPAAVPWRDPSPP